MQIFNEKSSKLLPLHKRIYNGQSLAVSTARVATRVNVSFHYKSWKHPLLRGGILPFCFFYSWTIWFLAIWKSTWYRFSHKTKHDGQFTTINVAITVLWYGNKDILYVRFYKWFAIKGGPIQKICWPINFICICILGWLGHHWNSV